MTNNAPMLQKVLNTIYGYNMIKKGDKILAAVSGGADSICMLYILNLLKDKLGFTLFCAHLNHELRGDAANRDEQFVIGMCERLGIKIFIKHENVDALAKQLGMTVEEAGRTARYAFFKELCEDEKINKVATAHNKNDNAETLLMRIIRGTGIDGLGGIPHVREDGVIRPLLDVTRVEIEKYCEENSLEFCTDATNKDNEYTRNRIRNKLLPFLEQEFNVDVVESLARLSENASADAEFLNGYAERLYERLGNPMQSRKPVVLHIESLQMLQKSIATRVIRLAAAEVVKDLKLERKHIDDVFGLLKRQTGAAVDLPKGLRVEVRYGWLAFENEIEEKNTEVLKDGAFFTEVSVDNSYWIDALGKNISLKLENPKEYKPKINETMLDFDALGGETLFLRNRRSGDKIVWFKDGRMKKVKNILIDKKIPKKDRDKIPLLCTGSEVVAIVGDRVSEKYKINNETERALVLVYGTVEKS